MLKYIISRDDKIEFHNHADYCIGTGRMDLALHKEYVEQLKLVQRRIGFRYIRGHGLFCRDMAIYQETENEDGSCHEEYNFTYLDQVMDTYRELHIRPFLELGFMPEKLASDEHTVFYWKGNITPPADYGKWQRLVQATLRHLLERYGEDEVLTWPIEVWNEPNLPNFWKNANLDEYLRLYDKTVTAIKEVNPALRVGGPATCGTANNETWIRTFLEYAKEKRIPVDFVTRHHYTSYMPDQVGHYGYIDLHDPEEAFRGLEQTRKTVDSFEEFRGREIHITEFNTSYIPNAPVHDTCFNAAYLAHMLSRLGDQHTSYSYWTFGDVFEEKGVPFTPFHGGFGLVANGCIPKPSFWTFEFYKQLQGECVLRKPNCVLVKKADDSYFGIAWNVVEDNGTDSLDLSIEFPISNPNSRYVMLTRTVDEWHGNPLRVWHDMGEPANPSTAQVDCLRELARPFVSSETILSQEDCARISLCLQANAVVAFQINPAPLKSDTGYDYDRTICLHIK